MERRGRGFAPLLFQNIAAGAVVSEKFALQDAVIQQYI